MCCGQQTWLISSRLGLAQSESSRINDLELGACRIEFRDWYDLLIRGIELHQEKFMVQNRVLPVGMMAHYFKDNLIFELVSLYYKVFGAAAFKFSTAHGSSLQ